MSEEAPGLSPIMTSVESGSTVSTKGDKVIAPMACTACRSKHLKCNGVKPCARCAAQKLECSFVRSRRGFRGPGRSKAAGEATDTQERRLLHQRAGILPIDSQSPVSIMGGSQHSLELPFMDSLCEGDLSLAFNMPSFQEKSLMFPQYGAASSLSIVKERCFQAFFNFIHPAHPFLLPKDHMIELLSMQPLPHLDAAIRYLGSFHVNSAPNLALLDEATAALSSPQCARDGFAVQANLLVAIGLDGNTELQRALTFLRQAENIAIEIGLHQKQYAEANGQGIDVLEESWRRTWWELFVVGGMIAGVHQQNCFKMNEIISSTLLPCEEQAYLSGHIPPPQSYEDFEAKDFLGEDIAFSSFTYRIAAIKNLGRILKLQQITCSDDSEFAIADAYLVNWTLHLSPDKKILVRDGRTDEMLFQAQMITNASMIVLHRQHSQLDSTVVQSVTSCAPHHHIAGTQTYNIHAAKIIQAADNISKLITLPVSLAKHTHFFTCVITLASIVHLSCWAALAPLHQDDNLKQQIRLSTGALKTLANVWPSAEKVGQQVKSVAQEVFLARKLASEEGFWNTFTNDEVMRSLVEDQNIIQDIQST